MKNENRTALIMGGNNGIGKAIALLFAQEGMNVFIAARDRERLSETLDELKKYNKNCSMVKVDVTREQDVDEMVRETLKVFGRIDILVNTAGISVFDNVEKFDTKKWKEIVDVNLYGTFLCTKKVLELAMIKQNYGYIVNVSSLAGVVGHSGGSAYCASKHAVVGFTKAVSEEMIERRLSINVFAVCPGMVDTPFWNKIPNPPDTTKMIRASDIANTVLFLVNLPVDVTVREIVIVPKMQLLNDPALTIGGI